MSSFSNPHYFFLFNLTNGKKKLGYGGNADEAYENLRLRLTEEEMALIVKDQWLRVPQRELRQHIGELG